MKFQKCLYFCLYHTVGIKWLVMDMSNTGTAEVSEQWGMGGGGGDSKAEFTYGLEELPSFNFFF